MENIFILWILIAVFVFRKRKKQKNTNMAGQKTKFAKQKPNPAQQKKPQSVSSNYAYTGQTYQTGKAKQTKHKQTQPREKSGILANARKNVRENDADLTKKAANAQEYTQETMLSVRTEDKESDVLKQVNDLIVMGYSGDLTFERDFVAEGIEMLNQFEL